MTAEVAIMNRFGIAIAADSAVTIGNERVWKATNKIFSLGPNHDVAIMIYGGGDFLGCPWEAIIKSFRERIPRKRYLNLSDYVDEFKKTLLEPKWGSPGDEKLSVAYIFVKELEEFNVTISGKGKTAVRELENLVNQELKKIRSRRKIDPICELRIFKRKFSRLIQKFINEIFSFRVPKYLKRFLVLYLFEYLRRADSHSGAETGVVFSGFGAEEIYPVCLERKLDGRYDGTLRWFEARNTDLNESRAQMAVVIPFAQRDMANVFMEGISPSYITFFASIIRGLLRKKSEYAIKTYINDPAERTVEKALQTKSDDAVAEAVMRNFVEFKQSTSVNPLMAAIQSLPREEMAAMAEALVELTSLRRKFDSPIQSVAGPVDVAFISKGDGLVWMKRKHYFQPELNGDFFLRRKIRLKGGSDGT